MHLIHKVSFLEQLEEEPPEEENRGGKADPGSPIHER